MTLQEQIRANRRRTAFVIMGFFLIMFALVMAIYEFYSPGIAGIIGIIAIGYGGISYFTSGKMVAAAAGAVPVDRAAQPQLYNSVDTLSIAAGIVPTPPIYLVTDPAPNAFAAGRTPATAYVAVTTGLLEKMERRELEGVIAHELAHCRNRDVELMTIATVFVGVIMLASDMMIRMTWFSGGRGRSNNSNAGIIGLIVMIVAAILAPLAAVGLQMALSRRREYLADAGAVEITGDPEGLALALKKLGMDTQPMQKVTRATAHMYIESPLRDHKGLRSSLGGMFDTHPPLASRIKKLEELGGFSVGYLDPVDDRT